MAACNCPMMVPTLSFSSGFYRFSPCTNPKPSCHLLLGRLVVLFIVFPRTGFSLGKSLAHTESRDWTVSIIVEAISIRDSVCDLWLYNQSSVDIKHDSGFSRRIFWMSEVPWRQILYSLLCFCACSRSGCLSDNSDIPLSKSRAYHRPVLGWALISFCHLVFLCFPQLYLHCQSILRAAKLVML